MQRHTRLAPTALAAIGLVLAATAALAALGLTLTRAPSAFTIVFCSERDGDSDIYTMNDDGSGVRQITNSESNEFDTACSVQPRTRLRTSPSRWVPTNGRRADSALSTRRA